MTVSDTRVPYELLVRYGTDGLPVGAQVQRLRRIVIDGELIKEQILDPEPIDVVDFPTSALMAETTAAALAQVTNLTASVAALIQTLTARDGAITEAEATIDGLKAAADTLRSQLAEAEATAAAAQQEAAQLRAHVAAMDAEETETAGT